MPVYIFQENAMELMAQVEGPSWKKSQESPASEADDCSFVSFLNKWLGLFESLKSQGKVDVYKDMTDLYGGSDLDFPLDVNGIGAIYGDGGWNRYVVKASGEVLFLSRAARNPANKERAANSGFLIL
jgi:hypothetical protein